MAISFPQFKTNNNGGSGSSISVTFTNPIAAGSFIAVVGLCDNGVSTITLTNDKGDAYTDSSLGIVTDNNIGTKVKTGAFLSATTGAQTVTLTPNVNFAFAEITVWEIAGITGPVVDKAVSGITTGTTATSSGSTGTLSASNEAAIGYGIGNWAYSAAGSGWTQDAITTSFNDLCEHQILSSNSSIAATGTIGNTVEAQMFCVTFMSGGAPAVTWFPTTGQNSERLPSLSENPDSGKSWFVRSPNPVPRIWLPRTGENRERDPSPYRRPDEPFPWFVRSPNPVPSIFWTPPLSDREKLPTVKENTDASKQWFVFPPKVPQRWLPNTGENRDRDLPAVRRPDEPSAWFVRSPNPVPTTWLPTSGEDIDRLIRTPDQYYVTWPSRQPPGQVNTISGMAWHISKEEMRPPKPPLNPDEFRKWFVKSPNPVPTTWLPTAGETEHPFPVKRAPDEPPGPWFVRSPNPVPITWLPTSGEDTDRLIRVPDQYYVGWSPRVTPVVNTISGMAWNISKEEMRPPNPPLNPDEFRKWFVRSPSPVPTTWLPKPYDQPPYPTKSDQDRSIRTAKVFIAPNTISGMAWFIPPEQIKRSYPGDTNQVWATSWNPHPLFPVVIIPGGPHEQPIINSYLGRMWVR